MPEIVNIAAYKFATLTDLPPLRAELKALADELSLRGTILLSGEGINLFLAGTRDAIDAMLRRLRKIPGLETLEAKESVSGDKPFNRMLVKIKAEIIAFGVPGIEPAKQTAKRLTARELKQWLDAGKPLTLLDTRNQFEIDVGTFDGAVPAGVDHFRDFPAAAAKLPAEMKRQPVVTFCTGGIRCEKATAYLKREGVDDVFHLDGGILRYLEEMPAADSRWQGECFVFDERVAVGHALAPGTHVLCRGCRMPVSAADRASPLFVEGVSCPRCHGSRDAGRQAGYAERHRQVQLAAARGDTHVGRKVEPPLPD